MEAETRVQAVRQAALNVLAAQDAMLDAWRKLQPEEVEHFSSPQDVQLLKDLMIRRIYPANAFAALVRIDRATAIQMLLSRYVGKGVDADRKFGGYTFELSTMLSDVVEFHGEASLRDLLRHPDFNRDLLSDIRFVDSIADALSMDVNGAVKWAQST